MNATRRFSVATAMAVAAGVGGVSLWSGTAHGAHTTGVEGKIRNALSAAPVAVARRAAVMGWPAKDGDPMPVLRKGSNGWTCLPDDPNTPSNDPQCMNANAMAWMDAFMAHKTPHLAGPGLEYVLQGCTVASNTDPFATAPPKGRKWIATGPHVMVFSPQRLDRKSYGTDPAGGMPYIRWAGTPYEHLVVPVPASGDSASDAMDSMESSGGDAESSRVG